jgi:hypothetical protein
MEREEHITQDAAEHYAVFVMAHEAERMRVATRLHSPEIYKKFYEYLQERNWTLDDFACTCPAYKSNVDSEIPKFVLRLKSYYPNSTFEFVIDEAAFRNLGLKADFTVKISSEIEPHYVSLKNYVGGSGITRPQVSSGTFLSFAAGFVFERVGVGTYVDPRSPGASFKGSNTLERNAVLDFQRRSDLKAPLQVLEDIQQRVRTDLLSLRFYDAKRVKEVVANIVPEAHSAVLNIFSILGVETVRKKFLERAGLDINEGVLYFDSVNCLDSITNQRFAELLDLVNDPATDFEVVTSGQSIRFTFRAGDVTVLAVDVPFTINTNGAWYRPKQRFEGTQIKIDKGHSVSLAWGEIRPYKSKELATSTNTYINLKATGIFD